MKDAWKVKIIPAVAPLEAYRQFTVSFESEDAANPKQLREHTVVSPVFSDEYEDEIWKLFIRQVYQKAKYLNADMPKLEKPNEPQP